MALIKCKECKKEISNEAKNCPSCGAPVKSRIGCGGFIIILFCIGVVLYNIPKIISPEEAARITAEQTQIASLTPEQRAAEEIEQAIAENEREVERLGLRWSYDESTDNMGRGTIKTASVRSLNEFQFDFPYQGAQRA